MKISTLIAAMVSSLILLAPVAEAKSPPANWDGLVKVPSKHLRLVYLQPEADFRSYSKVILDPTEVAFHKNWQRDYNSSRRDLGGKISDGDIQEAVTKGVSAANKIFASAWQKGGYTIATEPGPDVLKITTGILNINVSAPDRMTSGRSYSFSDTAGHATLVVEARDSLTNALLGRAVDQRVAGDNTVGWRSSVNNRADFQALVEDWARDSVDGMAELKRLSPIKR